MTPRNIRTLVVFLMVGLVCSTTTFAKKKKHQLDPKKLLTIVEVSPMSVTVETGDSGQEDYAVTGTTKATLDGLPVTVDQLRAGMVASFTLASDNQSVVSITAKDAPREVKKPKKGHDNVNLNVNVAR